MKRWINYSSSRSPHLSDLLRLSFEDSDELVRAPGGTVQAKAVDGHMAETMQFWAAMGHPCGYDFVAATFLKERPEYGWMNGLLTDMKSHPWTVFTSSMRK